MIGFNKSAQTVLTVMMIVFTVLLIILQSVRLTKARNESTLGGTRFTRRDMSLWFCELLTVISLASIVAINYSLYWKYIPADAPGCLPYISDFGVVTSNADPSKYAVSPAATYNATTYVDAVDRFYKSPNGLATGYFAWDGLSVTILNANAHQLKTGAPQGTSWVFQNLSTTVARPN